MHWTLTIRNAEFAFRFLVAVLFASSFTGNGAILLREDFDYADGALTNVSGGKWKTFSGTSGPITVSDSRARVVFNSNEDSEAVLTPPPSTDVVYAGFTVRFATLPSSGGSYFVMLKDDGSSSGFRARLWAFGGGAVSGKFRLGLSSTLSSVSVTNPVELSTNVDYRVVMRLWNATGEAKLWIDPAAETDASVSTTENPSSSTVARLALRQGGSGSAQLAVDDLIVGESFAEVVSTNALPSSPSLPAPYLSVLSYNAHGNSIADWTTNSPQVQAIGRQMVYLDPDIITFQEIPMTNNGWAELPDFVAAYRPGFSLATNSGTDGFIRSAILSRYPIARSQKWLDSADLKPFGYTNTSTPLADNFTRDLFEAEILVPGFDQPLHVFTTHLKSGSGDSASKRAAEASAVSNFFVATFLPAKGNRPYLLTGDFNEDVAQPSVSVLPPVQRLANDAVGLRLTTPRNPVTDDWRTFSIRNTNGLSDRYDYILPGGLLFSNLASNLVFRTDVLSPLPPNLFSNDSRNASDHLPVMMWFANPYAQPFRLLSAEVAAGVVTVRWESTSNRLYAVEASSNLAAWFTLASNLTAVGTNTGFSTNVTTEPRFFRVYQEP